MSTLPVHRRVWVDLDPGEGHDAEFPAHPTQCRERQTWCASCGCCEHCYHECGCTECGCADAVQLREPVLHVIEED